MRVHTPPPLTLFLLALLITANSLWAVPTRTTQQVIDAMQPLPDEARRPLDTLFEFASSTGTNFAPESVQPLVDFVRHACATDSGWDLPKREGAAGSAYIVTVKAPLAQYLSLNFHPRIPDFAVFPSAIRYSAPLDQNEMQQAYDSIGLGPTGAVPYVTSRMTGMEEITPNPESGSYFSYTNSRVFLRCKVGGQDVLFSCATTLGPSTFSNRGVPVGPPDQALFYYSEKPGLNMPGMTWMLSQIRRSSTLSVYIALNSNETAVATFAWLNAGWKGLNVTRACHILNSQKSTLDFSRRIAEHPNVSASLVASIVDTVSAMPQASVDQDYEKYLAHVRSWCDKAKKPEFCYASLLRDLYDVKATQSIPASHRRALIIQERVRALMDVPTWSSPAGAGVVSIH